MVWNAIAYNLGKRVKPIWDSKGLSFLTSDTNLSIPETSGPQLIWDMGGIIRNRPNPFSLSFSPETETYVDFGLIWGEDIIDLIMADKGKVILPLRNLQGFDELDAALAYAEDVTIGIDWSNTVESKNHDFSIDIVTLLQKLHQRGQTDILIYSLLGEYPYIPAGTAINLNINLAYLSESKPPPQWAKGVFVFE
jgi:hypothetical protein